MRENNWLEDVITQRLSEALDSLIPDQLQVIADRHEEMGRPDWALAYRWLAVQQLIPFRVAGRWTWRRAYERTLPLMHQLPNSVRQAMSDMPARIGMADLESGTMSDAYARAAESVVLLARTLRALPETPELLTDAICELERCCEQTPAGTPRMGHTHPVR